jgi:hypothetical protein
MIPGKNSYYTISINSINDMLCKEWACINMESRRVALNLGCGVDGLSIYNRFV